MNEGLVVLAVLSIVCFVVQLLPVISVPITGPLNNYNINLSTHRNHTFGVFGVCNIFQNKCSRVQIGYVSSHSLEFETDDSLAPFSGIDLPSRATITISKLLIVHVIAFCSTALLCLVLAYLLILLYVRGMDVLVRPLISKLPSQKDSKSHKPRIDITPFLNVMLGFSLLLFLLTLLAFLVDILLFIPNLSYLGWLQLLPIVIHLIQALMICFISRSISLRRYLNDDYKYDNDDMRIQKNVDISRWDDNASDDGFFVYTNGFTSNLDDGENTRTIQHGQDGGWIRHTPYNDEASIDSNHEDIELDSLRERPVC